MPMTSEDIDTIKAQHAAGNRPPAVPTPTTPNVPGKEPTLDAGGLTPGELGNPTQDLQEIAKLVPLTAEVCFHDPRKSTRENGVYRGPDSHSILKYKDGYLCPTDIEDAFERYALLTQDQQAYEKWLTLDSKFQTQLSRYKVALSALLQGVTTGVPLSSPPAANAMSSGADMGVADLTSNQLEV